MRNNWCAGAVLAMWQAGFRIRILLIIRIWIRIQHFRLNTDPDTDPIRIQGCNDQKLRKKITAEKTLNFFGSKTTIYLSLDLHKGRLSYRRSLQLLKENIQHLKTLNFLIFFLLFWVIFALLDLDPDPDSEYGPDPDALT